LRRIGFTSAACAAAVGLTFPALVPAQTAQEQLRKKRNLPNLIVSGVQEPPDFAAPGDRITLLVTVANEGRTRARRRTIARVMLSSGRAPSREDVTMPGRARIPALGPGQEFTRRVTVTIPADIRVAAYYFVACADVGNRVAEHEERLLNCKLSGQAVDLRARPVGPPGPTGPPGPPGPSGDAGSDLRALPRTELPLGDRLFEPDPADPGDDEGSTQTAQAMTIGPMTIHYLCRQTTNGDSGEPGAAFGDPAAFDEDGDEAKVTLTAADGTFSFSSSANGQRSNVPAGTGEPGRDDEGGGEGKRQVLAAVHDPDPDTTFHRGSGKEGHGTEPEYTYGFRAGSAYVAHSSGTEFILHAWAGIDVLGVGNDTCAFGGTVQVVQG
jgi:hypothetical protein